MTPATTQQEYKIDATGKTLGRIATEAAVVLRGKNVPTYTPHKLGGTTVIIENASKLNLPADKLTEEYDHYTGYPGGRKVETRGHLRDRKGYKPLYELAIKRMLPNNKLRNEMMKKLIIVE